MSTGQLYEEIGRLKQRVDYQRDELVEVKERNSALAEAISAMHRGLAAANRELERRETERSGLQGDIRWLNGQLHAQDEEIRKLRDQVTSAQQTIKVQSDQIATQGEKTSHQPRISLAGLPSRPKVDFSRPPPPAFNPLQTTQTSTYPPRHLAQQGYFPPPPTAPSQPMGYREQQMPQLGYQAPLPAQTPSYHQQRMFDSEYHQRRQTAPGNIPLLPASPSTMSHSSFIPSRLPPRTPSYQTQGALIPPQQQQQYATQSGVIIDTRREEDSMSLLHDMSPLFLRVENWAKRYCGIPSRSRDANIPSMTKERILALSNRQEASNLLSQTSTRFLVVAKLINHDLAAVCLRPSVITDFDSSTDRELSDLRNQKSLNLAPHVRRGMLVAAASIIEDAVANPRFESWVAKQVDEQTTTLWSKLGSLCTEGVPGAEAKEGLRDVWREAYRVGVKMACKPSVFTTSFPDVTSAFNPHTMANCDPEVRILPEQLVWLGATVRMAVTPAVTEAEYMERDGGARVESKCLHYSKCLLAFAEGVAGPLSSGGQMVIYERQ